MGDWIGLAAGLAFWPLAEAFIRIMDWRERKRTAERAWPRLAPAVEADPPPPIDFSEALRRRGRR